LEDTSRPDENMSETSDEEVKDKDLKESKSESEVQPEESIQEEQSEEQDEVKEKPAEPEAKDKEPAEPDEEITEKEDEESKKDVEETKDEPKIEPDAISKEKPVEVESKGEPKKVAPKKKTDHKDDFQYIVRISNTDVDGEKNVFYGLTMIKGIGTHMSTLITDEAGIDRRIKMGDLSDSQIDKLKRIIDNIAEKAPGWMLNHRRDYETGEDIHLIGPDIDLKLRDEINIMKKIRCYRGIRHETGLPVRGQRTRANNRKGLTLGVSKKRVLGK